MFKISNIKSIFSKYSKIFENYFFIVFLQGASLLIGLFLYPYLIRTLGGSVYGTYVFILSNIQFFSIFISFGFDFPALKKISLSPFDNNVKSQVLSEVFTGKICLFFISGIVFAVSVFIFPFIRNHILLYLVIFFSTLVEILLPTWYFQGIQKMSFVTYVNLTARILTIPLIFLFVKSPEDLLKYTLIVSLLPILGAIFTFFHIQFKSKIRIRLISIKDLKPIFSEAIPFFWNSLFSSVKSISVTFVIGISSDMKNVAVWDLANKIISIPRMLTNSINSVLFPDIVKNFSIERVKKIMRKESLLSLFLIIAIVVVSYKAVLLFGGQDMIQAYPIVVILSLTFYTWLIIGCYINFIFVPLNKNYLVLRCKLVEIVSLAILLTINILFFNNLIAFVVSVVLSELIEALYCYLVVKKNKFLVI